eukprot:scaffold58982_cov59-Phaeocystis_antarctica.AAC.5
MVKGAALEALLTVVGCATVRVPAAVAPTQAHADPVAVGAGRTLSLAQGHERRPVGEVREICRHFGGVVDVQPGSHLSFQHLASRTSTSRATLAVANAALRAA